MIPVFERAKTVHALDRASGHCDRPSRKLMNSKTTLFRDLTPCSQNYTAVSEEHTDYVFKVSEYFEQVASKKQVASKQTSRNAGEIVTEFTVLHCRRQQMSLYLHLAACFAYI
jgi:hypothetical protein